MKATGPLLPALAFKALAKAACALALLAALALAQACSSGDEMALSTANPDWNPQSGIRKACAASGVPATPLSLSDSKGSFVAADGKLQISYAKEDGKTTVTVKADSDKSKPLQAKVATEIGKTMIPPPRAKAAPSKTAKKSH